MNKPDLNESIETVKSQEYWDKITDVTLQPPKVTTNFEYEFAKWYEEVIFQATLMIEDWENLMGVSHACAIGCTTCCSQLIEIYDFELVVIVTYIKTHALEYIMEKAIPAADFIEHTFGHSHSQNDQLDVKEAFDQKMNYRSHFVPCIFLQDHTCLIYPVRPSSCANYYSYGHKDDCTKEKQIPKNCRNFDAIEDWIILQIEAFFTHNQETVPHYLDPYNLRYVPIAIRDSLIDLYIDK